MKKVEIYKAELEKQWIEKNLILRFNSDLFEGKNWGLSPEKKLGNLK